MIRRLAMPTLAPLPGAATNPGFDLTFICAGHSYKAFVRARNTQAASEEALIELAQQCPDFDPENARLTSSIQTR
jgi:hypothetical protein